MSQYLLQRRTKSEIRAYYAGAEHMLNLFAHEVQNQLNSNFLFRGDDLLFLKDRITEHYNLLKDANLSKDDPNDFDLGETVELILRERE